MHNSARTNQGGSVVGFLVVGVVLTVLTLGSVYLVQQRNQSGEPAAPSSSPTPAPSSQTATPKTSLTSTPAPSSSPRPTATPAPSSHPTTGTAPTDNLPSTGPTEDALRNLLPAALLTAMTVGYITSRKTRYGSLRR